MFKNNKDQMSPQETRNLFIFFVLAAVIFFTYDHFILQPRADALKAHQAQRMKDEAAGADNATVEKVKVLPRNDVLKTMKRINVENENIKGSIALKGAIIDDIALRDYFKTLKQKENVVLLSPNKTDMPRTIQFGWVSDNSAIKLPDSETQWRIEGNTKLTQNAPVTLVWDNGSGLVFKRTISLDENFLFSVKQSVTNNSGSSVTLYPYGLITQTGIPSDYVKNWLAHEGPIGYIGDELSEISYNDLQDEKVDPARATQGWIGMTEKYWLSALIPPQGQEVKYSFKYTPSAVGTENQEKYQSDFVGAPFILQSGQSGESTSHVFVGAKKVTLLNEYRQELNVPNFDLAVNFGWFWFLAKPFFYALHALGQLIGNFGVAIITLTLIIRTAVFPLTNFSYRSFAKMKKVTPKIMKLREKYGDDKQTLQQEIMKLYQKEGVNPMAGCFPVLLQIPVFFALYKVLFVTIEMRHAPFFGWIQDLSAPDPTSVFNLFGLIPWDPPSFLMIGVWPCVMMVGMIIQKNLNPPPQDPIQRDMMRFFPFFMTFILARFASGLVIYWTASAIFSVVQQIIIMKMLGVPIHLFGQTEDEKKLEDAVESGPAVHPLTEMAEDEVEDALFGKEDEPEKKVIKPPKKKKSSPKGKKNKGKK